MECFPTKILPDEIPFSSFPISLTMKTALISKTSCLISTKPPNVLACWISVCHATVNKK